MVDQEKSENFIREYCGRVNGNHHSAISDVLYIKFFVLCVFEITARWDQMTSFKSNF